MQLGEALDVVMGQIDRVMTGCGSDTMEPERLLDELPDDVLTACARGTVLWLSKYDVDTVLGKSALASLYNVWSTRTQALPWIEERRRAHLLHEATYIDLIVVVGENCNEPKYLYAILACLRLLEHHDEKRLLNPSTRDCAFDRVCRTHALNWLNANIDWYAPQCSSPRAPITRVIR